MTSKKLHSKFEKHLLSLEKELERKKEVFKKANEVLEELSKFGLSNKLKSFQFLIQQGVVQFGWRDPNYMREGSKYCSLRVCFWMDHDNSLVGRRVCTWELNSPEESEKKIFSEDYNIPEEVVLYLKKYKDKFRAK